MMFYDDGLTFLISITCMEGENILNWESQATSQQSPILGENCRGFFISCACTILCTILHPKTMVGGIPQKLCKCHSMDPWKLSRTFSEITTPPSYPTRLTFSHVQTAAVWKLTIMLLSYFIVRWSILTRRLARGGLGRGANTPLTADAGNRRGRASGLSGESNK